MASQLNKARYGTMVEAAGVVGRSDSKEFLQAALMNALDHILTLEYRVENLEREVRDG